MPEASGSSVPAWPHFCALNSHLILETASVEPKSTGLSRISQPETARPLGLRGLDMRSLRLFFVFVCLVEVAHDLGRTQQIVDLLVVVEAGVVAETHFRHVFHLPQLSGKPATNELRIAIERVDNSLVIRQAERRDIGSSDLQVRR